MGVVRCIFQRGWSSESGISSSSMITSGRSGFFVFVVSAGRSDDQAGAPTTADDSSNLPAMAARLTANKTLIMMADLFLILIGTPLLPSSNSKWEGSAGLSDVYLAWKKWVCS